MYLSHPINFFRTVNISIPVLKHIASKNADYSEIQRYLIFQHDEYTGKPILDESGRMIPRKEYYVDGINCDPFSFDVEYRELNAQYHKNQDYDDVKSHHYIISFNPKDAEERGLTGERAQQLGMEFARKNLPGHQTVVCTHTDGHNGSGNIHVHIVINSLRENLHQIDLLTPAKRKMTEQEYHTKRRGEKNLKKRNKPLQSEGLTPRKTEFQTQKDFLRAAIDEAAKAAHDLKEFEQILLEKFSIAFKVSRGRFSYLHPDRDKYITERMLGTYYEVDYLLKLSAENSLERNSKE